MRAKLGMARSAFGYSIDEAWSAYGDRRVLGSSGRASAAAPIHGPRRSDLLNRLSQDEAELAGLGAGAGAEERTAERVLGLLPRRWLPRWLLWLCSLPSRVRSRFDRFTDDVMENEYMARARLESRLNYLTKRYSDGAVRIMTENHAKTSRP